MSLAVGTRSRRPPWDLVLLVRQRDVQTFLAFAEHEDYLAGIGHRTAALADSRLYPLTTDDM